MNPKKVADELVEWLRGEVRAAGLEGLVFGLSGGIDSATVAILARRAYRRDHLAVIMPIRSTAADREDALMVVEQFGLEHRECDLTSVYESLLRVLDEDPGSHPGDLPVANLKPRLRMATLYYFANRRGYLVVGTGNRSELNIGYFTKHGDGGVDLLPLGHLVKGEVRKLAEHLGVPRSIIDKPPSAGMWHGQTDEGELGFSYEQLDRYLLEGEGSEEVAERVDRLRRGNAHKLRIPRLPPPAIGR